MIWIALLALGAKYDFEMDQMDVITAFLEQLLRNPETDAETPDLFVSGGEEDLDAQ